MKDSYPKNKIRTIVCLACGTKSTKRRPDGQQYCSLDCYRKSPRPKRHKGKMIPCTLCGTPSYIQNARPANTFFCSKKCANAWQGRNKTKNVCKICGKEFRRSASFGTVIYCSRVCRYADPIHVQRLREMNASQQTGKITKPEIIGYEILNSLGIQYIPQHLLAGKFCVDAFVESLGIVVQFDGDYWHCNPAKFDEPDRRQAKRMRLDKSQDAYLKKCGYHVIRLWESDLLKSPDMVKNRLQTAFADYLAAQIVVSS